MKWVVRAVTVLLVLCLGLAGALIYRLETEPSDNSHERRAAGGRDRQV